MTMNEIMMSLEMGLIYGIVAMGIYLTFRIIDFPDLTCDGSFVLGAALSSVLIKMGYNPWIGLFMALIGGSIAGLVTSLFYIRLKISNLLSGILMAFMLYSINLHIMGGIPNIALMHTASLFTVLSPLVLLLILSFILCALFGYLLMTDFGLALRSIGQNARLAKNGGININTMTLIGLALSNGFIAVGGALFSQHQGFADVGSGLGTVIIGLASVMIGERILPYRSIILQLASCILGSILYRLFISVALHSDILGLESQDLNLITGLMIIGIMYMPKRRLC